MHSVGDVAPRDCEMMRLVMCDDFMPDAYQATLKTDLHIFRLIAGHGAAQIPRGRLEFPAY